MKILQDQVSRSKIEQLKSQLQKNRPSTTLLTSSIKKESLRSLDYSAKKESHVHQSSNKDDHVIELIHRLDQKYDTLMGKMDTIIVEINNIKKQQDHSKQIQELMQRLDQIEPIVLRSKLLSDSPTKASKNAKISESQDGFDIQKQLQLSPKLSPKCDSYQTEEPQNIQHGINVFNRVHSANLTSEKPQKHRLQDFLTKKQISTHYSTQIMNGRHTQLDVKPHTVSLQKSFFGPGTHSQSSKQLIKNLVQSFNQPESSLLQLK